MTDSPLSENEFVAALRDLEPCYWGTHNRWYYQRRLPQKDAAIWLDRIVYHDGRTDGEGGAERWLRLGRALAPWPGGGLDNLLPVRRGPSSTCYQQLPCTGWAMADN